MLRTELIIYEHAYRWTRRFRSLAPSGLSVPETPSPSVLPTPPPELSEAAVEKTASSEQWDVALDVLQVRVLSEIVPMLERHPKAILAVEITPQNLIAVSQVLPEFSRAAWLLVGLLDRKLAEFEWTLRELGTKHIVYGSADIASMRNVWRANASVTLPSADADRIKADDVMARLPWRPVRSVRQSVKRPATARSKPVQVIFDEEPEVTDG